MSGDEAPTFFRLVEIEHRKVLATQSSRWVILSMLSIGVVLALGAMLLSKTTGEIRSDYALNLIVLTLPVAIGTPIVGILVLTGDWQHREVITIFSLVPRRGRVFTAKLASSMLTSILLIGAVAIISLAISLIAAPLAGLEWSFGDVPTALWTLFVSAIIGSLSGAAIGSALLSAPLAIVFVFLQAVVLDNVLALIPSGVGQYFQAASVSNFLLLGGSPLPAFTSAMLWLLSPLIFGYVRNRNREVT